ncbi:gamma-glutamylcyclotransferase [Vibrio sp. MACH09]|uniref:gamma-glutamylcyclotransferase family protein n=1 Tax=unclassified Vibrio TaxID=2614977 RepID=UPI001493B631|nr:MULTISPECIES: gamma-glutamylcyclotransferase family protein [unclassified Vibrio]NOI67678.1 gamma-glutamylcyclotransferase [Vibrio sp. 99-8-1]GLO62062.1 gamma-glutamylcyclotransferase [Vibrio sp. MACH09]
MQHLIFVYGTLRDGGCNHHLLSSCEYLGLFETEPNYQLYDHDDYPGLAHGSNRIEGEIYRIDDEVLSKLDVLEDVSVDFHRESIETPYGLAWVYIKILTDVIHS